MLTLEQAQSFNVAAFILHNNIRNENNDLITFKDHAFLAAPYMDYTPKIVCRKASQVGFSTLAIIRSFHLAKFQQANIIYTMPSRTAIKDFVTPKVDPLISNNPILKAMIGYVDSTALKKIGERFIYYRGSWEEASAISISAHILIQDEVDRSNQTVLKTYETRLDAAKLSRPDLGYIWKFSNPSIPGKGVDEWWEISDKKRWFIKCPHCNKQQYLDWPNNIDVEKKEYICFKCHGVLTPDDRRSGSWIKTYFGREISGYWFSRMMCPWVSAAEIIDKSKEDASTFHNFTLGKPYISADDKISRQSLVKCVIPDYNPQTDVAMGVDNGVLKHYVIGNRYGIFRVGITDSTQEIKNLRDQYNATMVIDANPYPEWVKPIVEEHRGSVFMHYYDVDHKELEIIHFLDGDKRGVVRSDRTKLLDLIVQEVNNQRIWFNMTLTDLENVNFIQHFENVYRVVETDSKGISRPAWRVLDGKPDHFFHALALWRVALTKTLDRGQIVKTPSPTNSESIAPPSQGHRIDLDQVVKDALNGVGGRDWKSI